MKSIILIIIGVIFAAIGAYWAGGQTGYEKCRVEMANLSNESQIAIQNKITETKGNINAEIFNTGVSDIRQQLRKHWTIRD